MVLSTIIARVGDGLPLAASMDDEQSETELAEYKNQAKMIFKKLTPNSESRCSIESGKYVMHYLIANDVCYLCVCEKKYPRKLAFSFLDELAQEFFVSYGNELTKPNLRPYAFIKFDTFIQKTKRLYQDSRTQHNLTKLNEDLQDVTKIMTKNMEDLLWRGDSLDRMSSMSEQLRGESLKYKKDARNLNLQALYRKYGLPAIVVLAFLFVIYLRFWWF
ncbi:snare-like protein [Basidiobolus meristosporus CBS 931.73]|uniref:Protein transport protein SEC22 n=1 Tax=Basidiobolus meristosporus CBS 931.73 TaxID=1314790 RepID=A0A1Y1XXX9_9FUNG|nr:snare-like protein [Basidiobolus meristosporus CBS 931.73]|eukprot:ORX90336.1 snare-like protein [Basidiobolus meristosporus CBS 931.73]